MVIVACHYVVLEHARRQKSGGVGVSSSSSSSSSSSNSSESNRQCGLCTLVARVFRRAVCGGGGGAGGSSSGDAPSDRRDSGSDSTSSSQKRFTVATVQPLPRHKQTHHKNDDDNHHTTNQSINNQYYEEKKLCDAIIIDRKNSSNTVDTMMITTNECHHYHNHQFELSTEDYKLLENIISVSVPGMCNTGRFLTMHKRRRKRLVTRALRNQTVALLDDVHHGLVRRILERCGQWAFNAFALETCAGGRSLPVLCVHLFQYYGLLQYFHLDAVRVWKLFGSFVSSTFYSDQELFEYCKIVALIEEGYHSTNPYHNSVHATDVTQAMHCFLQEQKIQKYMKPLEVMASLIGAVAHDLDHPGVNQHFLISTSNHLAALYENSSVLENHHWRSAISCLFESGVAEQLIDHKTELENYIRTLILATDITRQQEFINTFRKGLEENAFNELEAPEDRLFILQIALKCADISNPTRPWDISHKWSLKVCQEFFRQGDYERKLNLPVTSLCDRQSISVPKIQSGFFKCMVRPLFAEWHRFLNSILSTHMMQLLAENQVRWERLEAAEQAADETQTELQSDDNEDEISDADDETRGSSETLLLPLQVPAISNQRRHSMPGGGTLLLVPITRRRESMPPSRFIQQQQQQYSRTSSCQTSLLVSLSSSDDNSNSIGRSGAGGGSASGEERPLSAEILLPELSITSMTSSAAAERLSSVMQAGLILAPVTTKCLTRQQTFPPVQPYLRLRYLSTTAEMTSTCISHDVEEEEEEEEVEEERVEITPPPPSVPTITILSPNSCSSSSSSSGGGNNITEPKKTTANSASGKRELVDDTVEKEKAAKMVKLSENGYEKENLDPKRLLSLSTRRGSAPITPQSYNGDNLISRRGSMPADSSGKQETVIPPQQQLETWNLLLIQLGRRRGSAPAVTVTNHQEHLLTRHMSLNGRAKQLRRLSSGTLLESCARQQGKRTFLSSSSPTSNNYRRRGSLPVDMLLTTGH